MDHKSIRVVGVTKFIIARDFMGLLVPRPVEPASQPLQLGWALSPGCWMGHAVRVHPCLPVCLPACLRASGQCVHACMLVDRSALHALAVSVASPLRAEWTDLTSRQVAKSDGGRQQLKCSLLLLLLHKLCKLYCITPSKTVSYAI